MSKLYAIPQELRDLNQWVCTKADKNLFQINGVQATTDRPDTWNTFEACVKAIGEHNMTSVGLVLTKDDPYFIIDLDKTNSEPRRGPVHRAIHDDFNTFSEISVSGTGCHIVGKGSLPFENGKGGFKNKEWGVECYSSGHYLIFTGDIYSNKPIAERQDLLNKLQQTFRPIKNTKLVTLPTVANVSSDEEVIAKICSAANGEVFKELYYNGYAEGSDRSSVDIAFMNFMAFYGVEAQQAIRIIKHSALAVMRANGPKEKSKKFNRADYLTDTYNNAVNNPLRQMAPVNFDGLKEAFEAKIASAQVIPKSAGVSVPPGLVGEIAKFIYAFAPRPVPEVAIAGAIGLMAGVCGKAYNISKSGLNQYIMVLAGTGVGKDAAASGIDKLINEVSKEVLVANEFLGPSELASGQALIKYISTKSPCFVSILGEFGIKLQMMSAAHANAAEQSLRRTLLQLFTKSGSGEVVRSTAYADAEKNTKITNAPAFSILAESTSETVYEAVTEKMVTDGLLPRFIIIEYDGDRQLLNKNHDKVEPSKELITQLGDLMSRCKTMIATSHVHVVNIDPDVMRLLDEYDLETTKRINDKETSKIAIELWSRADLKIKKLAALIAVGVDMAHPVITKEMYFWAKDIVERNIYTLAKRFETGRIGSSSNELRQIYDLKRIIKQYLISTYSRYEKLGYVTKAMHHKKVFPHKLLSQRTNNLASYKDEKHRGRANEFLTKVLKVMIDNGDLVEVSKMSMQQMFQNDMKAYMVKDTSMFDDLEDDD
jgi:hypothetical protein